MIPISPDHRTAPLASALASPPWKEVESCSPDLLKYFFGESLGAGELTGEKIPEIIKLWSSFLGQHQEAESLLQDFQDVQECTRRSPKELLAYIHERLNKRGRFCLTLGAQEGGKQLFASAIIEKRKDGHLYVHIIKPWGGDDLHPTVALAGERKKRSYRYYPIRLKNDNFFKPKGRGGAAALRLLETVRGYSAASPDQLLNVYQLFVQVGEVRRGEEILDPRLGVKLKAGRGSLEQLFSMLLKEALGNDPLAYKKSILAFKYGLLKGAWESYKKDPSSGGGDLFKLCKRQFSTRLAKGGEEGWLLPQERTLGLALCDEIDAYFVEAPPEIKEPAPSPLLCLPSIAKAPLLKAKGGIVNYNPVLGSESPPEGCLSPLNGKTFDPTTILADLELFLEWLREERPNLTIDEARALHVESTLHLLQRLPLPIDEPGRQFWAAIPDQEVSVAITKLTDVVCEGMKTFGYQEQLRYYYQEMMLASMSVYAITDALCRRIPALKIEGFNTIPPNFLNPVDAHFRFESAWKQKQYDALHAHFNAQMEAQTSQTPGLFSLILEATKGEDFRKAFVDWRENKQKRDEHFDSLFAYLVQFEAIDPTVSDELLLQRYLQYMVEEVTKQEYERYEYKLTNETPHHLLVEWDKEKNLDKHPNIVDRKFNTIFEETLPGLHDSAFYRWQRLYLSCLGVAQLQNPYQNYLPIFKDEPVRLYYQKVHTIKASKRYRLMRVEERYRGPFLQENPESTTITKTDEKRALHYVPERNDFFYWSYRTERFPGVLDVRISTLLQKIQESGFSWGDLIENRDLLASAKSLPFSQEVLQALYLLKDFPDTRAGGLLQFIELYPDAASLPDVQEVIAYFLFEPGFLETTTKKNPHFSRDIQEVIDRQIQRYANPYDYEKALTWMRLAHRSASYLLKEQNREAYLQQRDKLDQMIISMQKEIGALQAKEPSFAPTAFYECTLHRLLLQIEEPYIFDAQQAGKLYGFWVALSMQNQAGSCLREAIPLSVSLYVHKYYEKFAPLLEGETFKNSFYRHLGEYFQGILGAKGLRKGDSGFYQSSDQQYVFDLFLGRCYEKGVRVQQGKWPEELLASAKSHFPSGLPAVRRIAGGVEGTVEPFRLRKGIEGEVLYERKIDPQSSDYWKFLTETEMANTMLHPFLWKGKQCWISPQGDIWVTNEKLEPEYKVLEQANGAIIRVSDNKRLFDPLQSSIQGWIQRIWTVSDVLLWGKGLEPDELVIPKLDNLTLFIEQKEDGLVITSPHYHGYVAAQNQECPELGGMRGGLVLEKQEKGTSRLLLVPCQNLNSENSLQPSPPEVEHKHLAPSDNHRTNLFAYEVDELKGVLRPIYGDRTAAKLYLIDIFLREKDYEKADFYIEDLLLDHPFTKEDQKILDDIIKNAPLDMVASSLIVRLMLNLTQDKVFFKHQEEKVEVWLWRGRFIDHFHMAMSVPSLREAGDVSKDWRLSLEEKERCLKYLVNRCMIKEEEFTHFWNQIHHQGMEAAVKTLQFLPGQFSEKPLKLTYVQAFHPKPKMPPVEEADPQVEEPKLLNGCRTVVTEDTFVEDFQLLYRLARKARDEYPPEFDLAILPYLGLNFSEELNPYFELLLRVRENPTGFPKAMDPNSHRDISACNSRLRQPAVSIRVKPPLKKAPYQLAPQESRPVLQKSVVATAAVLKGSQVYQKGERPLGQLVDLYFSSNTSYLVDQDTLFPLAPLPHASQMVRDQLQRLADAHQVNTKKPVQVFSLNPEDSNLAALKSALAGREQYLKSERIRLKGDIERLANTRGTATDDKERLRLHAKTLPGLRLETGIFEAIIAQDAHYLQTLNPFLDDTQAQKIYNDTLRYMLACSEYDQVTAAIVELDNSHFQDCGTILNRTRRYSPSEYPLLLAYEYATGNMLREEPDQATLLLKIFSVVFEEEPSVDKQEKLRRLFFEFQAGGGKTKVIAAILAAAAIHQGKMPVFVSLPEIYDVAKEDFRETLERVYRRKVDAIDLHLGSNPSLYELKTYHRQCKRGLKEKRGQIMTPESYHVLILSLEKGLKEGRLNKVREINKILRFYRQHAIFLIDESHRTVDSLLQANLALGTPRPLPSAQQDLFLKVYDLLLQNPTLQLRANQQALASDAEKKKAILGLANNILRNWGMYSEELLGAVTKLDADPSVLERYPEKKELLYLLRGICTEILPHALSQVEGMDHGPSIHPGNPLDGPRRFKNPSKAQFESVDVACALTIQGYYHRGLQSYDDLRQLLERMKQEFAYQKQQVVDFKALPVYQDFLSWQEEIEPSLRMTLDRVDDRFLQDRAAIMKLQSSLGKNEEAIRYFLKNYVLPRMMVFPYKYTSTAQELVAGAYSCVLFSATLGPQEQNPFVENPEQFGEDLTFQAHVVQRGCMPHNQTVRWVEDKGPYALLEELYKKGDLLNCEGITNLGGFSKHTSNEEWARGWLQFAADKKLSCKAALFKQEEPAPEGEIGEKVFYLWQQGDAKPERLSTTDLLKELRQRGLKLEEVAKIFGPDDTTGTDMPLSRHAKMILTIGEGTTSSALIQAIMRERLFLKAPFNPDESQSILWVGTPSLKAKIEEVIRQEAAGAQEIFSWAFEQQAKRETVAIFANGYQEIRGIYRQVALESMIEMEPEDASRQFNEVYLSLFEEDLTRDLQKLYGVSLREVKVEETLSAFADSLKRKYLLDNPILQARVQEVINRTSKKVQKVTLASQKNLSNTAQQQQVKVQVQIKVAEAKQQKAADIPFDKVVPGYEQRTCSLTSDAFWTPQHCGCKETFFDDLWITPNARFIDDRRTYEKPPSRLLLVGEERRGKWEYHCRLVSLGDAKVYQEEMLNQKLKPTQRVALLTLTGHVECRAVHAAIPEVDLKQIVESPDFQRLLTYVHLRNGKVYNEKVLREMIRQVPDEMRTEWSKIKKGILDKDRIQDMLIERLFEESAPATLDVTTEIAVDKGEKDEESASSLFKRPDSFVSSLPILDHLRHAGLKREKEERVDYVARKTHDFFFTRGWLRFLNRVTFGIVGFFIRRHYRKRWEARQNPLSNPKVKP